MKKILIVISIMLATYANAQWSLVRNFSWGTSWTPGTNIRDFIFLDDSTGVMSWSDNWTGTSGATNEIDKSTDYGTIWTTTESFLSFGGSIIGLLQQIQESDTIINAWGKFSMSTDRGNTWSDLFSASHSIPYYPTFSFLNAQYAIYASSLNQIRRYRSGTDVSIYNTPFTSTTIRQLLFVDYVHGFMIGNNGDFLMGTNDSGFTWHTALDTNIALNHIEFPDALTGYMVCDSGKIYKTIDGGISWSMQTTGTSENLKWCSFINDSSGLVAGNNGTILRTTNGGLTWTDMSIAGASSIMKIQLIDNNAYCVDDNDNLYRTNSALGIHETSQENVHFSVYPNPAHDQITIVNPQERKIKSLRINNSMGQCECSQTVENNARQIQINLNGLSKGIKYCTIDGETNYTIKIVVE